MKRLIFWGLVLSGVSAAAGTWRAYGHNPVLGNEKLGTCFDVNVIVNPESPAPGLQPSTYLMYFSWRPKKAIALVRSQDAFHWTQEPEICLAADKSSGWEDDLNRSCTVFKDGVWHMWYTGQAKDAKRGWMSRIGYATSKDGVHFTRVRRTPVMVPEFDFEKESVMNPYVRWDAKRKLWRMWYAAGETYEPNVLCYAESKDGLSWQKWNRNPMFGGAGGITWDRDRVGACEVHPLPDGRWAMFYIGYSDIDTARIGCAISNDGLTNWKRICANPIVAPDLCTWNSSACYKPSCIRDEKNNRWLLWYNGRNGGPEYIGMAIHEGLDLEKPNHPDLRLSTSNLLSAYVRRFNSKDVELYTNEFSNAQAEAFMLKNCPRFACPDKDIERTYYFRWWTFRKHLRHDLGCWTISEFLPNVSWAGKGNTIVCAAGHQLREARWLRDSKYAAENARFWLADQRATHRWGYSSWLFTGVGDVAAVTGDEQLSVELLDAAVAYYRRWEQGFERTGWPHSKMARMGGDGKGGFVSIDNYEGSEMSLGRHGYKPLFASAMWSEATHIAAIAKQTGRSELAAEFAAKAEANRQSILEHCWNTNVNFFTTCSTNGTKGAVRELTGYAPWYFGMPTDGRKPDWSQLSNPQGFAARYGLTFPERRAKGFEISYEGHECKWNGPSWPFATSMVLTALGNDLHAAHSVSTSLSTSTSFLFSSLLWQYADAQRRTHPKPWEEKGADWEVVPWIDENLNPDTGDWISRTVLKTGVKGAFNERGKDYNHSGFCDLVISGLVGFLPRGDEGFTVDPLFPATWDYLVLENLRYRGHDVNIRWQRDGEGLTVQVDGKIVARSRSLRRLEVAFFPGPNVVELENARGRAMVSLLGANVLSYVPTGKSEVLFRPSGGTLYRPGEWQNRGIPITFPWFDTLCAKGLPMHGFARNRIWKVLTRENGKDRSRIVLSLSSDAETRKLWPHDFELKYEIELADSLSVRLTVKNPATESLKLMTGLHPYYAISDIEAIHIDGFGPTNATAYAGLHKFLPAPDFAATIDDVGWGRRIQLKASGTKDAVLWNVGKHWRHFRDFGENDADMYVCVEPTMSSSATGVEIPAGGEHSISLKIAVEGGRTEASEQVIDPYADPDGDGLINLHEYWAGCNPNVPDGSNTVLSVMARSVDARLGGDPKARLHKFAKGHYPDVLNTNCWAYGVDTSSASPFNNCRGSFMGGTAITPRHLVMAAHYAFKPGHKVRFFGVDGKSHERVVAATNRIGRTDVFVCLLDADLPPTVRPAKLLPKDYRRYIRSGRGLPMLMFDFDEKASVTELDALPIDGGMADGRVPTSALRRPFFEAVESGDSGDPKYLILGDEAILVCHLFTWGRGKSGAGPFLTAMADELQASMDRLSDANNAPRYSLQFADFSRYDTLDGKDGIYPHLAMCNDEGECGTGAVVPWAGSLWVITYGPHCPVGSSDKLYQIAPDLKRVTRGESVGGTHANRLIHRETNQLLIGPYVIDAKGNVRVVSPKNMPGRLTGAGRHFSDPAKVYVATMDNGLYLLDMKTLVVKTLMRDHNGIDGKIWGEPRRKDFPNLPDWDLAIDCILPGSHTKGMCTGFGRIFLANNGEYSSEAARNPWIPTGVLGDCAADGSNQHVIRRCQFTDITTRDGIYGNEHPGTNPIWALGWDAKSVILAVATGRDRWSYYRLPKGSHCYDGAHGFNTEWPRIREAGLGDDYLLATMHGTFWKFPKDFSPKHPNGIRPLSTYLKVIGDFCYWKDAPGGGSIVFGCDDHAKCEFLGKRKLKSDQPKNAYSVSNLWFVKPDDLTKFGPPTGEGWVWHGENVRAGDVSDPYLWAGYSEREFTFVDAAGKSVPHELVHDGDWVRVKALADAKGVRAHFVYGLPKPSKLPALDAKQPYVDITDDNGKTFRFPNVNGDTRVICREVVTERDLLYIGGVFYEVPAENAGGFAWLRPIALADAPVESIAVDRGFVVINGRRMALDSLWKNGTAPEAYWLWRTHFRRIGESKDSSELR